MVTTKFSSATGLPKDTLSMCPECRTIIPATIVEEDGRAVMKKSCADHGDFSELIWSDAEFYVDVENYAVDGIGVENPAIKAGSLDACPNACGLCEFHISHTNLANVDLTNRCNLRCPICFANANEAGYVFEPDFESVVAQLQMLRDQKPVPTPAVQFSGGEPTIYPRFLDVLKAASEMEFPQIQVATNGIIMANRPEFAQEMLDAGLHTVYLQFDGLKESDYIAARGVPLLETKRKAIENAKKTLWTNPVTGKREPKPLAVLLVPTIVNTINDDQVGAILDFAIEHRLAVRGVNYQPVAFTGRIDQDKREKERFTLPDLVDRLSKQTDYVRKEDFFPVPSVAVISELVSAIHEPKVAFTAHPHCGIATFMLVDQEGRATPVTRFIDADGMFNRMSELAAKVNTPVAQFAIKIGSAIHRSEESKRKSLIKQFDKRFGEFIHTEKLPGGFDVHEIIMGLIEDPTKKPLQDFTWSTMFIGGMHFQDTYNYDIDRVRRCVIHYTTPDMRIIPFCAYNGGPTYREEVEKKHSIPLEEWRERNRSIDVPAYNGDK